MTGPCDAVHVNAVSAGRLNVQRLRRPLWTSWHHRWKTSWVIRRLNVAATRGKAARTRRPRERRKARRAVWGRPTASGRQRTPSAGYTAGDGRRSRRECCRDLPSSRWHRRRCGNAGFHRAAVTTVPAGYPTGVGSRPSVGLHQGVGSRQVIRGH